MSLSRRFLGDNRLGSGDRVRHHRRSDLRHRTNVRSVHRRRVRGPRHVQPGSQDAWNTPPGTPEVENAMQLVPGQEDER